MASDRNEIWLLLLCSDPSAKSAYSCLAANKGSEYSAYMGAKPELVFINESALLHFTVRHNQ